MPKITRQYLSDTEQFLAVALASEKICRGTSRTLPAAQPRRTERKGGGIKRALRGIFGGEF